MVESVPRIAEAYAGFVRPPNGQDLQPIGTYQAAEIIRHELREKRARMTYEQIYGMLGYRSSDGSEKLGSPVRAALDYLEYCGLVESSGCGITSRYWDALTRPKRDFREVDGHRQVVRMNGRLRRTCSPKIGL